MATEESIVRVDRGARADAVRAKIEQMKQIGFELVGPRPDLPVGGHVEADIKLKFIHHVPVKIGSNFVTKAPGEALLHSGPLEIDVPGSNLDI